MKNKTLATWLTLLLGAFGLHRFYLHGTRDAIAWVMAAAAGLGLAAAGLVASPITGPAGNHEYLLWLRGQGPSAGEACGVDAGAIKKLVTRTLATS